MNQTYRIETVSACYHVDTTSFGDERAVFENRLHFQLVIPSRQLQVVAAADEPCKFFEDSSTDSDI